ncbi:ATP-dependent DNA helicase [Podosphaera aphanis]|nr:ATP-dependent DNA helicase [Podosphaera aphanis]
MHDSTRSNRFKAPSKAPDSERDSREIFQKQSHVATRIKMETNHGHVTRDFHHPYEPYDIQETFMETVYQVLEGQGVGILESPTGTGKSLSLICGSITWLRDHKGRMFEEALDEDEESTDEPAWILEQAKARKKRAWLRQREDVEARLAAIRAKENQREKDSRGERAAKKRRALVEDADDKDEEQFILDDYESDHGQGGKETSTGLFSAETLALLEQIGMGPGTKKDEENDHDDDEIEDQTKIFFCSRTHSQLTQFVNELRRPKFPPSLREKETEQVDIDELKHLTLGSRKNLCINPKVNKLGSLTAINERCAELQKSDTAKAQKCSFIPNKDNRPLVNSFRDHALATIQDIEDMGALGKRMGICPYYASRTAIKPAEIVTLPYPLLLQKSAREALGISLKGHVIIIDEAHNLMDAISNINGVEVNLRQLRIAREQLRLYLLKFRNRLKGKNRVYIAQVVRVIDSLIGYLEIQLAGSKIDGTVSETDLLAGKGVDQVNFFKLTQYLQESKLARKVEGYATHQQSTAIDESGQSSTSETATPVLYHLVSLLLALTYRQSEGRFFFSKTHPDNIVLRYLLLDPSNYFQEIVSSARAVILAGGTMSPMSDYTLHLFPYLKEDRITTLSCGHVIPKANLLAYHLSKGPSNQEFEFTFKHRGNSNMIDELGRTILNICTIVPDGVVVFFPSYNYLNSIVSRWSTPLTQDQSLLQRLEAKKRVFHESKDTSVEKILQEYAHAIDLHQGGLLLSVVGGKLSEGINFSDALGRCVVIVGLPFPNINSAEWTAKIEYVEKACLARLQAHDASNRPENEPTPRAHGDDMRKQAQALGRDFYENACMRAVNQSVGRAIRHKGDYAAIVMIDQRFRSERITKKLPGWIQESLVGDAPAPTNFATFMGRMSAFFRDKRNT